MEAKSALYILKQTYKEWTADKATRLAAALSFYAIFSLVPLIIILMSFIGMILDKKAVQQMVISQIQANIGNEGAAFLTSALQSQNLIGPNIFFTVLTIGSLLLAAIGIFVHLKTSFNIIWKVESHHTNNLVRIIEENIISFGLVIIIGALFFVSLLLSSTITIVTNVFKDTLPYPQFFLQLLNQATSYGVMTLLFATLFKLLPNKKIRWSDVWEGAIFTATLFIVGKFFIGFYISHVAVASRYGAAGSLIVVLLWIYYSTQILFFGAEFSKVYAYKFGSLKKKEQHITPTAKVVGSFVEGFLKGIFRK